MHRETERPFDAAPRNVDGVEVLDQGGAAIPGHSSRELGDIVAEPRRERNCGNEDFAKFRRESRKMLGNIVEAALLEPDEVHLVDGEDDLPDAEQATNEGVPLGLRQHAFARIDQDHRELGG